MIEYFLKLFCRHKWKTHAKKEYKWTELQIVKGTEHFFSPKFEPIEYEEITEVLICKKCGEVKIIEY